MVSPSRITYCSNIHPAESWYDVRYSLQRHAPEVKARCSPDCPFPLGIWLSHRAVKECEAEGPERFAAWCGDNGCYVLTLNGFPFGRFHRGEVKEQVYLPDWRDSRRARYTCGLATLLDRWLPVGAPGSISTVPVGWGPDIAANDLALVRENLVEALEHLDRLRQRSSKQITLALEPEPGCHLQTTGDVLAFFGSLDLPEALRPLLGLCYDTCHQAVLFEDPRASLRALARAGIPLAKVQASSALRLLEGADPSLLSPFALDRYLHQTVIRRTGGLSFYPDLPPALAANMASDEQWRVHVHVPIFLERLGPGLATTRPFLEQVLDALDPAVPLEVETYTFSVLPPELRQDSLADSIAREVCWVQEWRARGEAPDRPTTSRQETRR